MYQDDEHVHVYIDTVLFFFSLKFFQSKGGGGGGGRDCATHSVPATGYLDCSVSMHNFIATPILDTKCNSLI